MNFNSASNFASAAVTQFNKTEDADKVDEAAMGNDPDKIAAANKVLELKKLMKGDTGSITDALGMNKDNKDKAEGAASDASAGAAGMLGKMTAPVQDAFKNVQSHLPVGMGGDANKSTDGTEKKDFVIPGTAAIQNLLGGNNANKDSTTTGDDNIVSQGMKSVGNFANDANERFQNTMKPAVDTKNVDEEVKNVSDFLTKPTFTSG